MSFRSIITFFQGLGYIFFPPPFVMIGDSVIQNMAATQPSLPEPFRSALNLGIGGNTTVQIRARISSIPRGTKMVLLEGGGNNFNPAAIGGPDSIVPDYTAMLMAIPTGTRVIVLGIARVENPDFNAQTAAANVQINQLAAGRPNTVVATAAQNVSMAGLTIDGVHPSPAGYAALIKELLPLTR